ncbi:MAG: hypothetical protein JO291_03380, partial [Acidimicrobiia bacterium]|nr:hypothetical protein [Acidimicrobiia bacterium]
MTAILSGGTRTRLRPPGGVEERGSLPSLPWRDIVRWALLGTTVLLALVFVDVARHGGSNPVSLIQPGTKGPAIAVVHQDFPRVEPPQGPGLDGQMFYAIARDPLHLDHAARSLDRPRYRLQRPLLPWLAWLLHPSGGGTGLIAALFLVGLAGIVLGALAAGVLGVTLGGRPWLAALVPLLPGSYWSLRVTVPDALALGLALAALALSVRRRPVAAVLVGCLAVLAKEPTILLFVGWGLWRRDRAGAALVAVPGLVMGAWMAWLRVQLPGREHGLGELALPPLSGLVDATRHLWFGGHELVGMASSVAALVVGLIVLVVRRGHPLWWPTVVLLAFATVMGSNVIGMNFGG